jgi:menaquinone-dependent protoporphyrinogen IX oxidase
VAAVLPRMRPAFKVAADSPRRSNKSAIADKPVTTNPWEPYRLKIFPKQINERWYAPGDMVYRRFVSSPGGGYWQYGDEFDYLKWQA